MVKLEEVADEDLTRPQVGPEHDEDEWDTDSDSDASSITSSNADNETIYDRIAALQDIVPVKQRRAIGRSLNTATSWVKSGLSFGGQALWVVSTSALLLGVPWAIAYAEDQQVAEAEQQMKMQQTANDFLTPGATLQQPGAPAKAGL